MTSQMLGAGRSILGGRRRFCGIPLRVVEPHPGDGYVAEPDLCSINILACGVDTSSATSFGALAILSQ
ncbi:hypothetical protein [Burkholderia ubonensis]|uniref:hypothetical protein n=1 Tax=Burkholderia ubonensis TaxID=101571 RepID=UPI0012FC34A2|nr:hypothetical protein [Burkholderia ubonensis]